MRVWWGSVGIISVEIVIVGFISVGIIGSIGIINRSQNQFQPQVLNRSTGRNQSISYGHLSEDTFHIGSIINLISVGSGVQS